MGNKGNRYRRMNDGLPQGSVRVLTVFKLYINDLPMIKGTKFQFEDDIAIICHPKHLIQSEETLNENIKELNKYFRR